MDSVIYLEPDEEITSVVDKLKKSKSPVVGIVAPRNAVLLQSIVNLKLLKKEVQRLKKDMALVTADPIGQNLALRTGLTVYANVHDTEPLVAAETPRPDDVVEASEPVDAPDGIRVHHYRQAEEEEKDLSHNFQSRALKEEKTLPAEAETPESSQASEVPVVDQPSEDSVTQEMAQPQDYSDASDEADTPDTESVISPTPVKKNQPRSEAAATSFSRRPKGNRKKLVIAIVAASALLIVIATGLLLLPTATVDVTVATEQFNRSFEVSVEKNLTAPDTENLRLPGRLLETTQESSGKVKSTGKKNIGEKAKGTVLVTNETGVSQSFEANTIFTASGSKLIFRADKAFTVPAATPSTSWDATKGEWVTAVKNGSATVPVTASEAGEKYNISATTCTLSGLTRISGECSEMKGGNTREVSIVSEQDIEKGKSDLSESLYKQAEDDLKKKAGQSLILSKGIQHEILEAVPTAQVGDEADEFELKVKIKSSTLTFDESALSDLVAALLKDEIPLGKSLIQDSNEYSISVVSANPTVGEMKTQVIIDAQLAPTLNKETLTSSIVGKDIQFAKKYLEDQPDISDVRIKFSATSWLKKLPRFSDRIDLTVNYSANDNEETNNNPESPQ